MIRTVDTKDILAAAKIKNLQTLVKNGIMPDNKLPMTCNCMPFNIEENSEVLHDLCLVDTEELPNEWNKAYIKNI